MGKPTPGALLAKLLSGDKTVTKEDFRKSTVKFFSDNNVHCVVTEMPERSNDDKVVSKDKHRKEIK